MSNRFPVLSVIAAILRLAGLAVVIIGVVIALYGWGVPTLEAVRWAAGAVVAIWGLSVIAVGEVLGVLVAIEENTRKGTLAQGQDRTLTAR